MPRLPRDVDLFLGWESVTLGCLCHFVIQLYWVRELEGFPQLSRIIGVPGIT
jgi:hypothetical protein